MWVPPNRVGEEANSHILVKTVKDASGQACCFSAPSGHLNLASPQPCLSRVLCHANESFIQPSTTPSLLHSASGRVLEASETPLAGPGACLLCIHPPETESHSASSSSLSISQAMERDGASWVSARRDDAPACVPASHCFHRERHVT